MNIREFLVHLAASAKDDSVIEIMDNGKFRPVVSEDMGVLIRVSAAPEDPDKITIPPAVGGTFFIGSVMYRVIPAPSRDIIAVMDESGNVTHWSRSGGLPAGARRMR